MTAGLAWLLIVLGAPPPPPMVVPPPRLPPVPAAPPVSDGVKDLFYVTFAPPHMERRQPGDPRPSMLAITRELRAGRDALKYCYESSLKSRLIVGRAAIRVTVNPDGRIETTSVVDDDMTDETVAPCLARVLRRFELPAVNATYSITLPFVFRSAQP